MKAVIDSNVAISATISEFGNPGRILLAWKRDEFEWITSSVLLEELAEGLHYPRVQRRNGWSEGEIAEYVQLIHSGATVVDPQRVVDVLTRDPDDNRLLEAALEGEADYIVTGDTQLLELREFEGVLIITPARFASMLANPQI